MARHLQREGLGITIGINIVNEAGDDVIGCRARVLFEERAQLGAPDQTGTVSVDGFEALSHTLRGRPIGNTVNAGGCFPSERTNETTGDMWAVHACAARATCAPYGKCAWHAHLIALAVLMLEDLSQ